MRFLFDNDALCVDCYNSIDEQLSKQVGSPDALVLYQTILSSYTLADILTIVRFM